MKKTIGVLSLILVVIMALGLTGCGKNVVASVYTETTSAEVENYAQKMESDDDDIEEQYDDGVTIKASIHQGIVNIDLQYEIKEYNDNYRMEGFLKTNTLDYELYYDGSVLYIDNTITLGQSSTTTYSKSNVSFKNLTDTYINDQISTFISGKDFLDIVSTISASSENFTLYKNISGETARFKFVYNDGQGTITTYYYLLDDGDIEGMKFVTEKNGIEIVNISYEPTASIAKRSKSNLEKYN